jgi:hypothetical protein
MPGGARTPTPRVCPSTGPSAAGRSLDEVNTALVRRGLRMSSIFGSRRHEHFPDGLPWTCTLHYQRRRMTIAYYTEAGAEREPTLVEVLASVFEDAWRFHHVVDLVGFSAAFGHERDGRRAEWAYVACGDVVAGLRHLLDRDYLQIALALQGRP